jgi:hypothetical protein
MAQRIQRLIWSLVKSRAQVHFCACCDPRGGVGPFGSQSGQVSQKRSQIFQFGPDAKPFSQHQKGGRHAAVATLSLRKKRPKKARRQVMPHRSELVAHYHFGKSFFILIHWGG